MIKKTALLLSVVGIFCSAECWALTNYTPQDLSNMTTDLVDALVQTAAIGTSFRAYMPASSLGITGFDVGVDVTGVSVPDTFKQAIATATKSSASNFPALIPIPSLKLHKGLPLGIDVGFTYLAYQDVVKVIGGDVQYNFLRVAGLPTVAARVAANYGKLYFLETRAYNFDLIASKSLLLIEPYVGAGIQNWNGSLSYPANINGLPYNVAGSDSGTNPHFFVGVPLRLLFLKITAEYDHSFAGFNLYGARFSIAF